MAVGFQTKCTSRAIQISRIKVLKRRNYSQKIKLKVRSSTQGVNIEKLIFGLEGEVTIPGK